MSAPDHSALLKEHRLRSTQNSRAVLRLFTSAQRALSHGELSASLAPDVDRGTLYRILHRFENHGLVHRVPDDEVSVKFALCQHCSPQTHEDQHLHFKCSVCGQTHCLEQQTIPEINLPGGYQAQQTEVLVRGVCPRCQGAS